MKIKQSFIHLFIFFVILIPIKIISGSNEFLLELDETQNWGQGLKVSKELFSEKNKIQLIELFENECFGKVLALNKCIQITEADEFIYNEMIAHVPLMEHSCPENILIIGGGGGGALREILKHSTVKQVDFIEIDSSIIQACQKYFPELSNKAFEDQRVQVIIQEGMKFLRKAPSQYYDIIICDVSEPAGISKQLYKLEFYSECQRCLSSNGIVCVVVGMPFCHPKDTVHLYHPTTFEKLSTTIFPQVSCYAFSVPCFAGGLVFMGLALNEPHDLSSFEDLQQKMKRIEGDLKYYDPAIHVSSFALPAPFLITKKIVRPSKNSF